MGVKWLSISCKTTKTLAVRHKWTHLNCKTGTGNGKKIAHKNISFNYKGKKLTVSLEKSKILTFDRKSHHLIEILKIMDTIDPKVTNL